MGVKKGKLEFGQNRKAICHESGEGQTKRAVELKNKTKKGKGEKKTLEIAGYVIFWTELQNQKYNNPSL